jgi:fucose 4-O-acetylase-like acetyltransferase
LMIRAVGKSPDETRATPVLTDVTGRRIEFDYLRAFVIVLVLFHHAILAYTTFAFLNPKNPIETFSPVVDNRRWPGFDLLALFNDTFFMPLLFFISGLFVWRSLARKGARRYLSDRLKRLGIPFVIAVPLLIPLAYYPAQLNVDLVFGGSSNYGDFWFGMVRSGFGTAGPLWFLWLLLAFDCVVTLLYRVAARTGGAVKEAATNTFERPLWFFGALLGLSTAAYLPMVLVFGPLQWIGIGPFVAQASRMVFYLVYFLVGTAAGAYGLDGSVLKSDGPLARRWRGWLGAGLVSYMASVVLVVIGAIGATRPIVSGLAFTVSCAALIFGALAIFLRFAKWRAGVFHSLSDNAYGIYIVHYVFVTWLQYGLLGADFSAIAKATLVFTGTLLLSWGSIAAIRRIPAVARVI